MLLGVLLAIVIVVCIALVGVILLQRSEGGALGMSGGGPGAFMTARGTGDLLTTTTQVLAAIFFLLCLAMTLVAGHNRSSESVVDQLKIKGLTPAQLAAEQAAQQNAASSAPAAAPAAQQQQPAQPPPGAAQAPVGLFGEPLAPQPKAASRPKPAAQTTPAAPAAPSNPLANFIQQTPMPAPGSSGH